MATAALIGSAALGALATNKASKRAASAQKSGQDAAIAAQQAAAAQARGDAIPLAQSAQQNALAGFNAALALQGQSIPQQIAASQAGNVAAQNTLLAGLPQEANAIFGNAVNLGALQPTTLQTPSSDLFNQPLPDFTSILDALNAGQSQGAAPTAPGVGGADPVLAGVPGAAALGGAAFNGFGPNLQPVNVSNLLSGATVRHPLQFGIGPQPTTQQEALAFGNLQGALR